MEIDDEQDDADTADMATSRAGMTLQICLCLVNCLGGRLESHCRVTAVPADVIQLPDDDKEEPPKSTGGRGRGSTVGVKTSRSRVGGPELCI